MSNILPWCIGGCGNPTQPVNFSKCTPQFNSAGLQRIFWTTVGEILSDWTDPAEWITRLSNTSTSADAIRTLHVVGSKPAPDSAAIAASLGRTFFGKKKHKVLIKIDETNDENYDMLRYNECGTQVAFWYESGGNKLHGGNDGITASIRLDQILVEDSGQLETFDGELSWESKFHPERITSPIAA